MSKGQPEPALERTRAPFARIIEDHGLRGVEVSVLARPLTPEEAIGQPGRRDFPIIVGKERILEAVFLGAKGHAFTDCRGVGRRRSIRQHHRAVGCHPASR